MSAVVHLFLQCKRNNISGDHCGLGDIVIKHSSHYEKWTSDPGTYPGVWQDLRPADVSLSYGHVQEKLYPRRLNAQITFVCDTI